LQSNFNVISMWLSSVFSFFTSSAHRLKVGDKIPTFSLLNQDGVLVNIADFPKKGKYFVVYFYPQDNTTGCTAEACAFNTDISFNQLDIDVIGISGDDVQSHAGFAKKYGLKFNLLADIKSSDSEKTVRQRFGLPAMSRVTYIVGQDKKIVFVYESMFKAKNHVAEVIDFLNR